MNKQENYIGYEYKSIAVKREAVAIYKDCLANFGWELIEEHAHSNAPQITVSPYHVVTSPGSAAVAMPAKQPTSIDLVELKFKRDRKVNNKASLDKLERQCEEALAAIEKQENKDEAHTMGISLGTGIVGTAFLGLAISSFVAANIPLGIVFTGLSAAGCAAGFFAFNKNKKSKAEKSEPTIQKQLDVVYSSCEQAHALFI